MFLLAAIDCDCLLDFLGLARKPQVFSPLEGSQLCFEPLAATNGCDHYMCSVVICVFFRSTHLRCDTNKFRGQSNISASVMEELLAEVNLCSGAGAADLDRLAADQRELLIQVGLD